MILNKVKIRNFRQLTNVDIDFAKDEGKNFTIIQGRNGSGKTTFLNALSWCLYGEESYSLDKQKGKKGISICNEKIKELATIGDEIEVRVEIEFLDDDNQPLIFDRVHKFIKEKGGLKPLSKNFDLKTIEDQGTKFHNNPNYTIEKKIPKEIKNYFFFKGEDLNRYFDEKDDEDIKNAVYEISQLTLLEKVQKNLPNVKQRYINELKVISPQIGEANKMIDELTRRIKESEEKLKKEKKDADDASKEIEAIFEELLEKNSNDVRNNAKRHQDLERMINSHNKNIDSLEAKISKYVLTNYPYVLSYEYFNKFKELGDESIERGEIPPQIKRSFIEELLEKGECICGTNLNEDEVHRKALEELLERTTPLTDNAEELTAAVSEVKHHILVDIHKFKTTVLKYHKELNELTNERKEFIDENKEIKAKLKANPIDEINSLMSRKKALEDSRDRLMKRIPNLKSSIERDKKSLGEYRKKLTTEETLYLESQRLQKKIDFCEKSILAVSDLYNSLKREMRDKIQLITKENFLKISWKKGAFEDIVIHEDYSVGIINNLGTELTPSNLSGGEQLTLGLCFMSALHNISGFNLPIIMDAPSSVLDEDMVYNVAKALPELNGGKQFILLVLDKDYPEFKNTLNNVIGRDYLIQWENSVEGAESGVVLND